MDRATSAPPIYVAIGDVHGHAAMLDQLYAAIREETAGIDPARPRYLVHLGDYIDRGPDSRGVLARIREGLPGFATVALRGNHEQMMLDAVTLPGFENMMLWLRNGGNAALASYGLEAIGPAAAAAELAEAHADDLAWLDGLPHYWLTEHFLFVHAGIVPGRPIAEQKAKDLIWIRDAFLNSPLDHGVLVVHGHTPTYDGEPEVMPNRLNLDTGAAFGGPLTAAVLDGALREPPTFLQVFP